jgi:hypothetical protein
MRTRTVVGIMLVTLLAAAAPSALAQTGSDADAPEWEDEAYETFSEMVPKYNERVSEIDLGIAGDQLADRRVNVYIEDGDQTAVYSFYMDERNRIRDLQRGAHPDAQLKITTRIDVLEAVASADDPAAAFRVAVRNDEIRIAGERGHPVEQAKWTVVNAVKGLFF